jgi:soluble lytic murein transglycosylase-like protein
MSRFAGPFIICVLALANNQANAQAGAMPPASQQEAVEHPASSNEQPASAPGGASEVCRTLEQAAAENGLPVEFFARVIWQESRFNATAVSAKGAEGIAQFMPQTADWRGLADPFNPIEALRHSASYLHDLMAQFGNLGLAAAGYRAGPGQSLACRQGRVAGRDAQLRRHCHRLDRGRVGITFATASGRRDDPPGRTLWSACQSRFGPERGSEADRILRSPLGHPACSPSAGKQGVANVP